MKMPSRVLLLAVAMWALALCTLAFGIADSIRDRHNAVALGIAIFLAVAACVPTGTAVAEYYSRGREDASVEHIIEVVDALHEGRRDVTRLH